MGAAAKAYVFPTESVTELTVAVESFQPTTTTFRFPAVCAPAYVTVTEVSVPCGVAELVCTKEIADTAPTVKFTPLLGTALTVTTTLPVVAPVGTGTTMLLAVQEPGVAVVPLKVTLPLPWVEPKFAPVMVTEVPTGPDVGLRLAMLGAGVPPEAARKATICMIHC